MILRRRRARPVRGLMVRRLTVRGLTLRGWWARVAAAVAVVVLALVAAGTPGSSAAFTARITNTGNLLTLASTRTCASEYARTTTTAYATYPLTDAIALLTAADTSGNNRTAGYWSGSLLAHSLSNACTRDLGGSTTFDGLSTWLVTPTSLNDPEAFTVEIWFRTSTARGMLVGFNPSRSGAGSGQDRHLYLDDGGHVVFGVGSATKRTVRSPGTYADGAWHQAVGTFQQGDGMVLYVDGQRVDALAGTYGASAVTGWWRVGYGDLTGWPGATGSTYVKGQLGQVGIWLGALTPDTVSQHYAAGT